MFEGKTYPLDVLIYATGFEVQKTGIYNEIRGRDGREINETYADGIRTLFGVHTHGYPNLFIMGGYQASFQFNLTFMLQTQGDHIAECIKLRARPRRRRDRRHAGDRGMVGAGGDRAPRQDQPQRRLHARLLQLRRRVQPPPGRQLQRRLPAYYTHMENVRAKMEENFTFTKK